MTTTATTCVLMQQCNKIDSKYAQGSIFFTTNGFRAKRILGLNEIKLATILMAGKVIKN